MAREVAIKVKVNGTEQAVKSIDDLEGAVEQLKAQLKGTEIGSQEFKKLSGEVQKAESQLKTLNKSFEGLEPQQKAEAFVKLGEGIVGSFAIATAALTAFGVESEDVAEAQLAVSQALTAAIGIRQIAEAGLQAQVIATTISQKAYNLAATAGNVVTKAFYTTIAANPIGAVVVVVAALAAGIYALIKSQEEQIDAQEEVNKVINKSKVDAAGYGTELISLQKTINDGNASLEDRQLALNRLKDILPEVEGAELDNEEALKKVNKAIERNIELSIAQAKTEGLKQFIVQKTKELTELTNSSLEDQVSLFDEIIAFVNSGGNAVVSNVIRTQNAIEKFGDKYKVIQDQITAATEEYEGALRAELEVQQEVDETREEAAKRLERQTENTKRAEEALKELLRQREENVKRLVESIQDLGTALNFDYGKPKILTDLEELDKRLTSLAEGDPTFTDAVEETFGVIIDGTADVFGDRYDKFRERLSKDALKGSDELGKTIGDITREAAGLVQTGDITIDAFIALQNLTKEYSNFQKLLTDTPPITDTLGDVNYFDALKSQLIQTGQVIFEEVDGKISLLDTTTKGYQDALLNGSKDLAVVEEQVRKAIFDGLIAEGKTADEALRIAEVRTKAITELASAIVIQEEQIRGVLFESQKIQSNLADNNLQVLNTSNEAYKNFVLNNLELLTDYYSEASILTSDYFDDERLRREDLEALDAKLIELGLEKRRGYFIQRRIDAEDLFAIESELLQQGIFLEDLTAEERLKVIEAFYAKKKQLRDNDAEDEEEDSNNFFEKAAENLRSLANTAQVANGIFQEQLRTQLDTIAAEEEALLEKVIGDSEEANQKRLEIQEDFEEKRKEISKQGRLADLQLTRLQAIANVAEAITKAQAAGPLIGQILAGITAALGAVQVGVVTSQINALQSFARGGLLQGNSHENGGIPLASGGAIAEGGEAVVNRRGSIDYRGLLNEVNMSSGGAPIVSSSFDDTRLVEAITKQNRTPIKAYVLEQDISRSQSINKRLQQLSKI